MPDCTPLFVLFEIRTCTICGAIKSADLFEQGRRQCRACRSMKERGRGPRRPRTDGRRCTVDGCRRPYYALDMCRMHRGRVRRTGGAGGAGYQPRARTPVGPCIVEGCTRVARYPIAQMCSRHYDRVRDTGSAGVGEFRATGSTAGTCGEAECSEPIEAKCLCSLHYYRQYREANRDRRDENGRKWREANAEKVRIMAAESTRRRRARLRQLPAEPYTMADIIGRDGNLCVLCGDLLDLAAPWPAPLSPTVEHLECISWPDSAGDVLANVGASHYTCNCRRSDNPHPAAVRKRAELLAAQEATDREAIA